MQRRIVMKRILGFALLAIMAGGLWGCSDDDDDSPAPAATAEVRVAHLSPNAPNVDVWVDGDKVLSNVPFQVVSGYLELSAGSHRIVVVQANTTTPSVIDANVTVEGGKSYTVAATGLLAGLQPLVLEDDRVPASGQAKVRFVHASPDAPAVDVAVRNGAVIFPNVSFRGFDGYDVVAPASYNLDVRLAGQATVALPVNNVAFEAGRNYTVFAVGQAGNGTLGALAVIDYQP
jgi:hypothetical protein